MGRPAGGLTPENKGYNPDDSQGCGQALTIPRAKAIQFPDTQHYNQKQEQSKPGGAKPNSGDQKGDTYQRREHALDHY